MGAARRLGCAELLWPKPRKVVATPTIWRLLIGQKPTLALPSAQGLRAHPQELSGFLNADHLTRHAIIITSAQRVQLITKLFKPFHFERFAHGSLGDTKLFGHLLLVDSLAGRQFVA